MMPEASSDFALGKNREASRQINQTIRLTMFISIPATAGMMVLAKPIMGVLFPASSALAANLLMTGALYVIFSALATITGSVLQSIGQQKTALVNAGISLGINLGVLTLLANILFSAVICVLNSMSIRKFLGHKNEWKKTYLQPAIASAGMGLLAAGVYYGLFALTRRPFIALMIAVLLAVAAYLILYVVVTGTGEEEMRRFPMGGKVVKILRILKIYR